MSRTPFILGILSGLLMIYVVYAAGETAQCYNAAIADPYVILSHGKAESWGYCVRLHLLFPFSFLP